MAVNLTSIISSFNDLFGNFSEMTIDYRVNVSAGTISYRVMGRPVINSSQYFEVGFTKSQRTTTAGTQDSSAIIWFGPTGTPEILEVGNRNFTGQTAQASAMNFTGPFLSSFSYLEMLLNDSAIRSHFLLLDEKTEAFGPTEFNVVAYSVAGPFHMQSNLTIYGASLRVGTVSVRGQKTAILTFEAIQSSQGLFRVSLVSAKE